MLCKESMRSLHEEETLLNQKQPVPAKQKKQNDIIIHRSSLNFKVTLFEVFRIRSI